MKPASRSAHAGYRFRLQIFCARLGTSGAGSCRSPQLRFHAPQVGGLVQMFQISRRDLVLGAAGAYAAFGLSKPIAFIGAAQAQQTPPGPAFKKYKVGDIEVISLYDGVWEKAHDANFIKGADVDATKAEPKAGG